MAPKKKWTVKISAGFVSTLTLFMHMTLAASENITCPTCIHFNKICQNVTYLFDLDAPFRSQVVIGQMGILRSKNILYFSFEPVIEDIEYYKVGFINLDNTDYRGVLSGSNKGIINNFGNFDFNQDRGIIYLGGSDGIFELDTNLNTIKPYSSRGDKINSVFVKSDVFFVREGEDKIIRKIGDNFYSQLEYSPVKKFVITKDNVIVLLSSYGLFASKHGHLMLLSRNPYFRGLTIDLENNVHVWWIDTVYRVDINKENFYSSKLVPLGDVPKLGAMTFDNNNNILFSSARSLFTLTPTNATLCDFT